MEQKSETAYFAAGCFWHVEEVFRHLPGVTDTKVGYMGGNTKNPTYREVCTNTTGHAETVKVIFDPDKISYQSLLETFWKNHDPTTLNRQGPDIGSQYRSVIFTTNSMQEKEAKDSKNRLEQAGRFTNPIVTEIIPAPEFWLAEEYHQRYIVKHGQDACPI